MRRLGPLIASGAAFALAGCVTHPLPENFAGVTTVEIVNKARCETSEALKGQLIAQLLKEGNPEPTKRIGRQLRDREITIAEFRERHLTPVHPGLDEESYHRIQRFRASSIAYQFTLTATENNNNVVDLELKDPLTDGFFSLKLTGGDDRERKSERKLSVVASFEELLMKFDETTCAKLQFSGANWLYPMAGRIGLEDSIRTFLELEYSVDLGLVEGQPTQAQAAKIEEPDFSETLTFETMFSVSAAPKVVFTPTTDRVQVSGLSSGPRAKRGDNHVVQITIKLADAVDSTAAETGKAAYEGLQFERARRNEEKILERLLEVQ